MSRDKLCTQQASFITVQGGFRSHPQAFGKAKSSGVPAHEDFALWHLKTSAVLLGREPDQDLKGLNPAVRKIRKRKPAGVTVNVLTPGIQSKKVRFSNMPYSGRCPPWRVTGLFSCLLGCSSSLGSQITAHPPLSRRRLSAPEGQSWCPRLTNPDASQFRIRCN